jgi:hypothetical protein
MSAQGQIADGEGKGGVEDWAGLPGRYIHESSTASDHDILDIGEGFVFGATNENRSLAPDTKVFKKPAVAVPI